jgi:hypothetical protein
VSTPTAQIVEESGLPPEAAAELEPLLAALRGLEPAEAPEPSAELAALLASPRSRARGRRTAAAIGAAAALGSLTVTGVAAAANELPEPAQRFVSQLSERYLPFEFPRPVQGTPEDAEPGVVPGKQAPDAPDQGIGTEVPVSPATATPSSSPQPSRSPSPSPSGRTSPEATPSGEPSSDLSPVAPDGTAEPETEPEETSGAAPTSSPEPGEPTAPVAGGTGTQPPEPRETPVRETGDGAVGGDPAAADPTSDATAGGLAPGTG